MSCSAKVIQLGWAVLKRLNEKLEDSCGDVISSRAWRCQKSQKTATADRSFLALLIVVKSLAGLPPQLALRHQLVQHCTRLKQRFLGLRFMKTWNSTTTDTVKMYYNRYRWCCYEQPKYWDNCVKSSMKMTNGVMLLAAHCDTLILCALEIFLLTYLLHFSIFTYKITVVTHSMDMQI